MDAFIFLSDKNMKASMCVFHQRFSTNTLPQWKLAQPFRYLAHNGEINTIQGNRNWYLARRNKLNIDSLPELNKLHPLISREDSDSYTLDNMLELLLAGDMGVFRAMRTLMPPAWQNNKNIDENLKACYEYHSMHMEPWDGPAGIVLTDGRYAACALDRNGLRPLRYSITSDEMFFVGDEYSEQGQEYVNRFSSYIPNLQKVLDEFIAADLAKDPPTDASSFGQYIDFDFSLLADFKKRFVYDEMVLNREGKYLPYLNYHFEGFPLIASLSKLTKLQSDIRFVENKILENILKTINEHEGGISANTYQTLLESSKSSFYTGDLVDASVVMGKKDANFLPSRV